MAEAKGVNFSQNVLKARQYLRALDIQKPAQSLDDTEKQTAKVRIDLDATNKNHDVFVAMSTQRDAVVASHNKAEIKFLNDALDVVLARLRDIAPSLGQDSEGTEQGLTYTPDVGNARAFLKDLQGAEPALTPAVINAKIHANTPELTGANKSVLEALRKKQDAIKTDSDPAEVDFYTKTLQAIQGRLNEVFPPN